VIGGETFVGLEGGGTDGGMVGAFEDGGGFVDFVKHGDVGGLVAC